MRKIIRPLLLALSLAASASAQTAWTLRNPLPTPNHLLGVAAHGGITACIGIAGTILVSRSGGTWSQVASGTREDLRSIAWLGDSFLATGAHGTLLHSADGSAWKADSIPGAGYLLAAAAGGGKRVVLGGLPYFIYVSDDGKAWKPIPYDTGSVLRDLAWNGSRWIAVGEDGLMMTSTDGSAWTKLPALTRNPLMGIAWTGSLFIAAQLGSDSIFTSPDGQAWTKRPLPGGSGSEVADVIWTGSQAVAVGYYPSTIWTSPDGKAWTVRDSSWDGGWDAVTAAENGLVAVGPAGRIATSPDGKDWTLATPARRGTFGGVAWGRDRFLACTKDSLFRSADGIAWSPVPLPAHGDLVKIAYGNGQWILVGEEGTLLTSDDGAGWTARDAKTRNDLVAALWIGDRWVVAGHPSDSGNTPELRTTLLSSRDGAIWDPQYPTTAYGALAWSGQRLVAVGSHGDLASSGDSLLQLIPRYRNAERRGLYTVIWTGTRFVAFGKGIAVASDDGIAWKETSLGDDDLRPFSATWDGDRIVAAGWHGSILSSPDGETWTRSFSGVGVSLYGLAWNGKDYVAVGENGAVMTSPAGGTDVRPRPRAAAKRPAYAPAGGTPSFALPGGAPERDAVGRRLDRKPFP